jgi:hypothetical protein
MTAGHVLEQELFYTAQIHLIRIINPKNFVNGKAPTGRFTIGVAADPF